MTSCSSFCLDHMLPFGGYSHSSTTLAALDLASGPKKKMLRFPLREEKPRDSFATAIELQWIKRHLPSSLYDLCLPQILRGKIQVNYLEERESLPRLRFLSFDDRLVVELVNYGKGPRTITWINKYAVGREGLTKYLFRRLEGSEITTIYTRCMEHLLTKEPCCARFALLQSLYRTLNPKDRRVNWHEAQHSLRHCGVSLNNKTSLWRVVNLASLSFLPSVAEEG